MKLSFDFIFLFGLRTGRNQYEQFSMEVFDKIKKKIAFQKII